MLLYMLAGVPPLNNFNAEHVGEGRIRVTWDQVTDVDRRGFRIYYKLEPDGDENVFVNVDDRDAVEATIEVTVGGNYSITIVTLTEFLPSAVAGPVTVTVGKQNKHIELTKLFGTTKLPFSGLNFVSTNFHKHALQNHLMIFNPSVVTGVA